MGEMRNSYEFQSKYLKGVDYLRYLGVDGRMNLKEAGYDSVD
jgi:hypothetical protein